MSRAVFATQRAASREVRQVADHYSREGCEFCGYDSHGHLIYRVPAGDGTFTLPSSPAPHSAWRKRAARAALAVWIGDAPGWVRTDAGHGRSRPRTVRQSSGFSMSICQRERARRDAQDKIARAERERLAEYDEAIGHANDRIRACVTSDELRRAVTFRDRLIRERQALAA